MLFSTQKAHVQYYIYWFDEFIDVAKSFMDMASVSCVFSLERYIEDRVQWTQMLKYWAINGVVLTENKEITLNIIQQSNIKYAIKLSWLHKIVVHTLILSRLQSSTPIS